MCLVQTALSSTPSDEWRFRQLSYLKEENELLSLKNLLIPGEVNIFFISKAA